MSLKPIRPAPLPPSSTAKLSTNAKSITHSKKNGNNNDQKITSFNNMSIKPTIIRPKLDGNQKKVKKLPPPRPAPPKINKVGNGGTNGHKLQDLFHSNMYKDDLTIIFGEANDIKQNSSKQPLQTNHNKNSRPPKINHRSMKKRAPNPLENQIQTTNALIDFDSPVSTPSVSSNNEDICKIFGENFNSFHILKPEKKSLLDMDDPPLENFNSYSLLDLKSNSLPIENGLENIPMNGIEKCEKYVSSVNSLTMNRKLEEMYHKKPVPAPRRTSENQGKENKLINKEFQQAVFSSNVTKNKFPISQSDNLISNHQIKQENGYLSNSSNSINNFQEYSRIDHTTNNGWNDLNTTMTHFHSSTNEVIWDHCASPFSDISSYNTMGSVDSNDESADIYECPPEPKFPPPPPPKDILLEEEANENYVKSSVNSKTFQTDDSSTSKNQTLKALYDFDGQSSEEISFKAGDILYLESKVTSDWWRGSKRGQTGIFPASFVEIFNSNERSLHSEEKVKVCLVTALYQFDGEEEGDLSFKVGDEIRVLSRINKDWLFGECKNRRGQFPVSFVKQKQSDNICGLYVASFQFVNENSDELGFHEGDKITVTDRINDDWWKGFLTDDKNKREGIFPCAFVQKFYA